MTDKRHHKALPMANWDADVLASRIENCRCEQLCKCMVGPGRLCLLWLSIL